jgi:uracil DNA glycosylase
MHKVTELALKTIHPKWLTLFNTPTRSGEMLIDVFDRTITTIVGLGVKLCPDTPDKILRCLRLDPDLIKVVICGQDCYPQPGVATGLK